MTINPKTRIPTTQVQNVGGTPDICRMTITQDVPDTDHAARMSPWDVSTKLYVALGDSMSIDDYPSRDLQNVTPENRPIGAASLLFRNDDELWPEFANRDLLRLGLADGHEVKAVDGALLTTDLWGQPDALTPDTRVVSLTVGGNDLFFSYVQGVRGHHLEMLVDGLRGAYKKLVLRLYERAPNAVILLTTVYDPTDGTGSMNGMSNMPLQHLDDFNSTIRETAAIHDFTRLADVHEHFLGHGLSAEPANRWYWPQSIIEPSARGASEIRRSWLDALGLSSDALSSTGGR